MTRATQQNLQNQITAGYAPLTERSKGRTAVVRTRPRCALTLRVIISVTTLNPPDTALILTRSDAGSAANGSKGQPSSSPSSSSSYSSSGRWGPSPSRAGTGGGGLRPVGGALAAAVSSPFKSKKAALQGERK